MIDEKYIDFFANTFLFNKIPEKRIKEILYELDVEEKLFSRSEIIYSPDCYSSSIGFIESGECTVSRLRSNGGSLSLNSLRKYDSFGISAVFSDGEGFPTLICAKRATKVFFIDKESLICAVNKYCDLGYNIIVFLTGRVNFLNKKIATLAPGGCEEKLGIFLLNEYKKRGSNSFSLNCKSAAESLGIGRASLYRGIKALSDEGFIEYVDKKIYIKDPKGLEGISK